MLSKMNEFGRFLSGASRIKSGVLMLLSQESDT